MKNCSEFPSSAFVVPTSSSFVRANLGEEPVQRGGAGEAEEGPDPPRPHRLHEAQHELGVLGVRRVPLRQVDVPRPRARPSVVTTDEAPQTIG